MTNNQYRFVSPINFGFTKTIGSTEGVYLSAALKISEALSMVTLPALICLNTTFFLPYYLFNPLTCWLFLVVGLVLVPLKNEARKLA